MDKNIDDDKLEERIMHSSTLREKETSKQDIMFKALGDPIRRKLITSIGLFGKTLSVIEEEMKIDKSLLNYHLDFLKEDEYAVIDDNMYKLNRKGLTLLSNI